MLIPAPPGLLPIEARLEVKRRVALCIDLQRVAFAKNGVLRSPGGEENRKRAFDMGLDVVSVIATPYLVS